MSRKVAVLTDKAPKPRKELSQAIIYNDMIYCSGSLGINPATGKFVEGGVGERTAQALRNLSAILEAGGSRYKNVVKANVFMASMDDVPEMNKAYEAYFAGATKPCRSCVAVKDLPRGTDVEIEFTAFLNSTEPKL